MTLWIAAHNRLSFSLELANKLYDFDLSGESSESKKQSFAPNYQSGTLKTDETGYAQKQHGDKDNQEQS